MCGCARCASSDHEEKARGKHARRVREEREETRLRQPSLAAGPPMLWWYTASRTAHHMLDGPRASSSGWSPSAAVETVENSVRCAARDILRFKYWEHSAAGGNAELGPVETRTPIKHQAAMPMQKKMGEKRTLVRRGPHYARNISPRTLSSRAHYLEPRRRSNRTSSRVVLPGIGTPRLTLRRNRRTTRPPQEPHAPQSTRPPCLPRKR